MAGQGFPNGATRQISVETDMAVYRDKHDAKPSAPVHGQEPLKRSYLERSAFALTITSTYMVDGIIGNVGSQFRYRYFHDLYTKNSEHFNATTHECDVNEPPDIKAIENQISDESANWSLYKYYVTILPLVVASIFLGLRSDLVGRRFLFLFPLITSIAECVLLAIVIRLNLHFGYTLIGNFINSISGGTLTMTFAGYSVISDSHGKNPQAVLSTQPKNVTSSTINDEEMDETREQSRTLKMILMDSVRRVASAACSLASGYLINYAGFFYATIIAIGLKVLLLLYAFRFLTESGLQRKSAGFLAPIRSILRSTKDPWKRRVLILANVGQLVAVFGFVIESEIMKLYQMSPPFCFNAIQLGWYLGESQIRSVVAVPLLALWRRLGFNEGTIAAIGTTSEAAGAFFIASIPKSWVFFVAPVLTMAGSLATSITKVITSRLIGRSALASTFSLMLAVEEFFFFAAGLSANYVYEANINTVPSAPIYMAGAAFVAATMLYGIQAFFQRRAFGKSDVEMEIRMKNLQMSRNNSQISLSKNELGMANLGMTLSTSDINSTPLEIDVTKVGMTLNTSDINSTQSEMDVTKL